jgi:hypothetical protein
VISTYFPYNGANIAPCPGLSIVMSNVPEMDCGSSSPSHSRDICVIYSVIAERECSETLISYSRCSVVNPLDNIQAQRVIWSHSSHKHVPA